MNNGEQKIYENEFSKPDFTLDEPAYELFFKQNFSSLCAFCQARFGFDTDATKDVVHTAFIKLWEARHTIFTSVSLRAYMFRTVINASLDVIKQDKTRQKYITFFQGNITEVHDDVNMNKTDYKLLAAEIQQAISELPDQMRAIFELSRNEGLKYGAIAERLTISVKTVETQMSRALQKLRQKLGHYLALFSFFLLSLKFL